MPRWPIVLVLSVVSANAVAGRVPSPESVGQDLKLLSSSSCGEAPKALASKLQKAYGEFCVNWIRKKECTVFESTMKNQCPKELEETRSFIGRELQRCYLLLGLMGEFIGKDVDTVKPSELQTLFWTKHKDPDPWAANQGSLIKTFLLQRKGAIDQIYNDFFEACAGRVTKQDG